MDLENHTLVFDRGNNSKKNMALVADAKMHYVGALTPYHNKQIIAEADGHFEPVTVKNQELAVYRTKQTVWGEQRTILVFVSHKLKTGQLRGIYKNLHTKQEQLEKLQRSLRKPSKEPVNKAQLQTRIKAIAKGQFIKDVIQWSLEQTDDTSFELDFKIDQDKLDALEGKLGFRILMTDRHDWTTARIISTFYGQSFVEQAFKNIKNPYHLTLKPQHHWTDQKIRVHYFMCVLGYLMSTLIWKRTREKINYNGTLDNLLDNLNNIRLATLIEKSVGRGKPRLTYQLEQMDEQEIALAKALSIENLHESRPKIDQVGVYAD